MCTDMTTLLESRREEHRLGSRDAHSGSGLCCFPAGWSWAGS